LPEMLIDFFTFLSREIITSSLENEGNIISSSLLMGDYGDAGLSNQIHRRRMIRKLHRTEGCDIGCFSKE